MCPNQTGSSSSGGKHDGKKSGNPTGSPDNLCLFAEQPLGLLLSRTRVHRARRQHHGSPLHLGQGIYRAHLVAVGLLRHQAPSAHDSRPHQCVTTGDCARGRTLNIQRTAQSPAVDRYRTWFLVALLHQPHRKQGGILAQAQPLVVDEPRSHFHGSGERTLRQISAETLRAAGSAGMVFVLPVHNNGHNDSHNAAHHQESHQVPVAVDHSVHITLPHHSRHRLLLLTVDRRLNDIGDFNDTPRQRHRVIPLRSHGSPRKECKDETDRSVGTSCGTCMPCSRKPLISVKPMSAYIIFIL